MAAKFQAYRNLNKPGFFSIKQKGIVIDYAEKMVMKRCVFHVSETGRKRVVKNRRKAVHAWISGEKYSLLKKDPSFLHEGAYEEVWYSPYFTKKFMGVKSGKMYEEAEEVVFFRNKCYCLIKESGLL